MTKTVYIDPGHGGSDPGAVFGGRRERDDNLRLARALADRLERQGIHAPLSHDGDRAVTIAQRAEEANRAKADLFVSLHRNAFDNAAARGVEIWVYTSPTEAELTAAGCVLGALCETPIGPNRGVKRGNYGVLRLTDMPAMLVELGFITNDEDNRLFDAHIEVYADALALGICAALDLPYGEASGDDAPPGGENYYRVQVGAFSGRANAERYLETVRELGLPAYLVEPNR